MAEPEQEQTQEIAPVEAGVSSLTDVMNTRQLKAGIKAATEQRALLVGYVKEHLQEGVDYGVIESTSAAGRSFKSKPTLFKPGQEKIFSLMGITSRLMPDEETLKMLGNESGVVAYLCKVYRNGKEIAEGRGAAKVGDNKRDVNSTIKIAEKRARMDACLSLGFSEFFTQDLDDPEYRNRANGGNVATKDVRLATPNQKQFIRDLLAREGVDKKDMQATLRASGVVDPTKMTFDEASKMINDIKNDSFVIAHEDDDDSTPDAPTAPTSDENVEEGELVNEPTPVVDEQFKRDVKAKFDELQMDSEARTELYKRIIGRPLAPTTDEQWIKVDAELNKVAGA